MRLEHGRPGAPPGRWQVLALTPASLPAVSFLLRDRTDSPIQGSWGRRAWDQGWGVRHLRDSGAVGLASLHLGAQCKTHRQVWPQPEKRF